MSKITKISHSKISSSNKSRFDTFDEQYLTRSLQHKDDKKSILIEKKIDKWLNERGIRNIYLKEEGLKNIREMINKRKSGIFENEIGMRNNRIISLELNLKDNKLFKSRLSSRFNNKN